VTAPADEDALVLLRFSGELSTKAKATRRRFVTRLVRNLDDALAAEELGGRVERRYDRLFVHLPAAGGAEVLARVFGVQSLSVARRRPVTGLDDVVAHGEALFGEAVRGRRFAVRARAVGQRRHDAPRGRDVEVRLGAALLPLSAGVDLDDPEITARIELYDDQAYYFTERLPGAAGLPLGTESRAVALVSGGFDSPVAAWHLLRRGVDLDYVFCNLGGATHRLGTLRVMQVLARRWSYGTRPRLHAIDFEEVSRELRARTEPRYWQVILKRLMLRAAEAVARTRRAHAIVTGEAVGQVSSQTLVNLEAIGEVTRLPVLRPLVGFHKDEIIARAHEIGTGPLSAVVDEYCALVPRRPATSARVERVRAEEAKMDLRPLETAIAAREVVDLRSTDPDDTGLPDIEIDTLPDDAVVLDLRTRGEYEAWHAPGALHLDFGQAAEAYPHFARDAAYVLYCEYGLKSAHLAEMMRREGLSAWHFRGGTRALRRHLEREGGARRRAV
jgi:thiamine biosynthesis protein ThiI